MTYAQYVRIVNLLPEGPQDYMDIDAQQRDLHSRVSALEIADTFLIWEANDVYTAGRRTKPEDIPDKNIPVIEMDRGGSDTYHGPGQIVMYPIIKVKPPQDVVAFVRATERALITALRETWGIESIAIDGRSGVWIRRPGVEDRKICAIGIKFAQETTMHGLAFNVTTDLTKFGRIVPCGINDAGVTSLAEQGVVVGLEEAATALLPYLEAELGHFALRNEEA